MIETSKRLSAIRFMSSSICENSVFSVRRNLRRAGVLKNKSFTSMVVPSGCAVGLTCTAISRPSANACHAASCCFGFELKVKRETELIDANASPRKPSEQMFSRSSSDLSLLVAWRDKANVSSSLLMPEPLSRIRISLCPPRSISI